MVWQAILRFVYAPPPSVLMTAMTVISAARVASADLKFSKFWNWNTESSPKREAHVSSWTGMLVLYTPALLAGAASFWIFPAGGPLFLLLRSAVTLHFLKRVLEVLFVHKFSGFMAVDSMCVISLSYTVFTATSIYAQYLSWGLPDPGIDLTYPRLVLFLVGLVGNFYHLLILSRLRSERGKKEYQIPLGVLFDYVTCPHFLFEIVDFAGLSFISQTIYIYAFTLATVVYLMGRSYATRRWYISKFEDFPRSVKALFPFIF